MHPSTAPLKVFPTSDLIAQFCQESGFSLSQKDTFELLEQMFSLLDLKNPMDSYEHQVALDMDRFIMLAHYPSGEVPEDIKQRLNKAAYTLLVRLYARMAENAFPVTPGMIDHTPYLMVGNDVCLKPFTS